MTSPTAQPLRILLPVAAPLFLLGVWALLSYGGFTPAYMLPPPHTVGRTLWIYVLGEPGSAAYAGRFAGDTLASLWRICCGFGLATALGLPLGVLSGRLRPVQQLLAGFVDSMRAVPGICWLPLALVWFGIGFRTTVFLITLAAFFPIYLNTAAGVASVPGTLVRAGAMLGLSGPGLLRQVVLPAGMSHILAGLRLGLGLSFAYLVLGELTGVPDGLGATIMDARMLGRVDMVMGGIVVIALIGLACDRLLMGLLRLTFVSARRCRE
ncbi:MAG: ABC transporter permease [Proteobacteria bacterium]|nr:ABC transporter permease [Pseudomonadota bacterium]